MSPIQKHLRNTFLAGIFAAIPIGVTIFLVAYVERITRKLLFDATGVNMPFLGVIAGIAAIYVLGVIVSSLIGKLMLSLIDKLLLRVPVLKDLYQAWKQVTLTPGGKEGMFAKVVLVATAGNERARLLGFTSGDPLPGDPNSWCVFVPNSPNPIQGRLYFVRRDCCSVLDMSAEEAFKVLLSTGNYVSPQVALPAA